MFFRKITAGLAAFSMAAALFWGTVPTAKAEAAGFTIQGEAYLAAAESTEELQSNTALRDYLKTQLLACRETVDLSAFNIPASQTNANALGLLIQFEIPEAFHIDLSKTTLSSIGDYFIELYPTYLCTAAEFQIQLADCRKAAEELTSDLGELGDVEKALLLHDRLALRCEYDTAATSPLGTECLTLYSALVRRKAVCQGYAIAYRYLLNLAGMESRICTSTALNHAWNIVTVNGTEYHVDVTWDDPVYDISGRVNHTNFLRSSAGIATNHLATDYDTTPTDTTYDSYFWQSSKTGFQLVGDAIYYIDNTAKAIKCYSDQTVLLALSDTWTLTQSSVYTESYSRLATDSFYLLYSTPSALMRLNPATGKTDVLYQPESIGEFYHIYGFTLQDGMLIYEQNNSATFSAATKETYQQQRAYQPGVSDVVLILKYLIGQETEVNIPFLDQNGDNVLTISDAVNLLHTLSA